MLKEFFEGFSIDPKTVKYVSDMRPHKKYSFQFSIGLGPVYVNKECGKTYQDFIAWLEECEEEERRISLKTFESIMDRAPILTAKVEDWLKGIEE